MDTSRITVFTLGHGSRTWEEFLAVLRKAGVRCLVDVRRFPGSRRYPHFARENLEASLSHAGVRYIWEGERLGGRRRPRPDSPHTAIRTAGFRGYADHMQTEDFRKGIEAVLSWASRCPTAIMCAERLPWRCHRFFLADYLILYDARVIHLIGADQEQEHRLNPLARIERHRLIYNRRESTQLDLEL